MAETKKEVIVKDFFNQLFSKEENGFCQFMAHYLSRSGKSRIHSYQLFFAEKEGLFAQLVAIPQEHGQYLAAVALRNYIQIIEEREKQLTNSKSVLNLLEKSKDKVFIRLIATWLLRALKSDHSFKFEKAKFGNIDLEIVSKEQLAPALEKVRADLNVIIGKLTISDQMINNLKPQIEDATAFMQLLAKKEYQLGAHEEKLEYEWKIAVSLLCYGYNQGDDLTLTGLYSVASGKTDNLGNMQRSHELENLIQEKQKNISLYPKINMLPKDTAQEQEEVKLAAKKSPVPPPNDYPATIGPRAKNLTGNFSPMPRFPSSRQMVPPIPQQFLIVAKGQSTSEEPKAPDNETSDQFGKLNLGSKDD